MLFMGQTQINNRQNHKDKGLQGDDQNMEYWPPQWKQYLSDWERKRGNAMLLPVGMQC